MFKLNGGQGAIICDNCRVIIVSPAAVGDEVFTPFFCLTGETYCCLTCLMTGFKPATYPPEDSKMIETTRCPKCNDALDQCDDCAGLTRMQRLCSKHTAEMSVGSQAVLDNDNCDRCADE